MQKLSDTYKRIADLFGVLASIFMFMALGAGVSATFNPYFDSILPLALLALAIGHLVVAIIFFHKYKKEKFLEEHVIDLPSIIKGRDRYLRNDKEW